MRRIAVSLLLIFPLSLVAERAMPSLHSAGVPVDGGQTCSQCHNNLGAANSDLAGSLSVSVGDYTPGLQQLIHVKVQHPRASRYGFQMTIRAVTDETLEAGTMSPVTIPGLVQVRCDDGTRFGSVSPCNGMREFAEHMDAPGGDASGGFDFMVSWTPPGNELGDIRVYVAAVAADGDGTASGDHVYTVVKSISAVGGCPLPKRPTLQTITNGASFQQQLSSNAMISFFGFGFQVPGRTRGVGLGDITNNAFPTTLACVSILATGAGLPASGILLPLAYVQTDQINAQAPVVPGTGPVNLTVIVNAGKPNELRSDIATVNLQTFAPAFFVFPNSQSIAAQVGGSSQIIANPAVVAGGQPAQPGQVITLYGTGFGGTNPTVPTGQLAAGVASLTTPITVMIGTTVLSQQDVLYAGLSPGSINGLYQFNVRVPTAAPDGDVPVSVAIGGFQTQSGATIPVKRSQ
jgi:uncharacterized protein (TIGR03437 family)